MHRLFLALIVMIPSWHWPANGKAGLSVLMLSSFIPLKAAAVVHQPIIQATGGYLD